jgi:hypothetical protein
MQSGCLNDETGTSIMTTYSNQSTRDSASNLWRSISILATLAVFSITTPVGAAPPVPDTVPFAEGFEVDRIEELGGQWETVASPGGHLSIVDRPGSDGPQ